MNKTSTGLRLQTLGKMQDEEEVKTIVRIDIEDIIPDPSQPRKSFDDESLAELANNLQTHGQAVPILVRENPEGNPPFMVFDGERRWRAASLNGSPAQLDAVVYHGAIDPDVIIERQFIMNDQREDMPFVDRAEFYQNRIERYGSIEAVADHLKINARRIYKVLQAQKLEGVAGEARDLGLSGDAQTLNSLNSLAKQAPEVAEKLVEEAKEGLGKITRKAVTQLLSQAKAGKHDEGREGEGESRPLASTPDVGHVPSIEATVAPGKPEAHKPSVARPPIFYVYWQGVSEQKSRWAANVSEFGDAKLCATGVAKNSTNALIEFGDGHLEEFPIHGIRLERIV